MYPEGGRARNGLRWAHLTAEPDQGRGAFFNYVDQIVPIIDHLPKTLTFVNEFLTVIMEELHSFDIYSTTYLRAYLLLST